MMNILGMGPAELLLVLALALIVFGPDKLPEIARQLGRTIGELRRVSSEVTREIQRSIEDEPSGSGPRIVRQNPPFSPPAANEPTTPPPPVQPAPDTATILPPVNGGASAPPVASQGSWEEGPPQPSPVERGHDPRPTA